MFAQLFLLQRRFASTVATLFALPGGCPPYFFTVLRTSITPPTPKKNLFGSLVWWVSLSRTLVYHQRVLQVLLLVYFLYPFLPLLASYKVPLALHLTHLPAFRFLELVVYYSLPLLCDTLVILF